MAFFLVGCVCFLDLEVKRNVMLGDLVGVFRTKKECSSTSNAVCECVPGFRCLGAGCAMCEEYCQQGQELTQEGRCFSSVSCRLSTLSRHSSGLASLLVL